MGEEKCEHPERLGDKEPGECSEAQIGVAIIKDMG